MPTPAATIELVSIGKAAAELQRPVATIRRAAESLGIVPAFRINDVPHFTAVDLERIAVYLAPAAASPLERAAGGF